jgi:predicted lipoprotein with Yx(FWY)xxD motif
MHHRRNTIFSGAVALSSFIALGAGAAASASTPHTSSASPLAGVVKTTQTTLHTTTTRVGAKTESILVNAKGLPLYYCQADTAKRSRVSGGLARPWPALVSVKPTASGVKGKVGS